MTSHNIVDIMTFCNHEDYLNLKENYKAELFIAQRVILKCFYRGTRGNENLTFTKRELDWVEENTRDAFKKILYLNFLEDEGRKSYFHTLLLALGRRSGKTLLISIIMLYEAYKLIVVNNGDPFNYYGVPNNDAIAIISMGVNKAQSSRLASQVRNRMKYSKFFNNNFECKGNGDIFMKLNYQGGGVKLLFGHSNPDSVAGYNASTILYDEMAFYGDSGRITAEYIYNRLKPSLTKFNKYGDGKIVMVSSPNTESGFFYDKFIESRHNDSILSFQLPTWKVNDDIEYNCKEMKRDREINKQQFDIEYGAQFAKAPQVDEKTRKELKLLRDYKDILRRMNIE